MRPSKDEYFLSMAQLVATRSTCIRRSVGCVLVNKMGHVLATGYNGVATGQPHCNELDPFSDVGYPHACEGAFLQSGAGLDKCEAIHAEQNALLQCKDVYDIETCYVTVSPCITCVKLLLNTSCQRIIYAEEYAHNEESSRLWRSAGRQFTRVRPQGDVGPVVVQASNATVTIVSRKRSSAPSDE